MFLIGDNEEKDLGSEPDKAPFKYQQSAKENEEHKDVHSSWNTESKLKDSEKARYHIKNTEKPVYQEIVTKKPEPPTRKAQVETKAPVVSVIKVTEKSRVQPPTQKDLDDADAELEMKLEELTPPEKQPDTKTDPPTFHHWREFVDNNPNFPYTIPRNPKTTTPKPSTKKPYKQPTTEHHTTERITTKKTTVKTKLQKTTGRTTTKPKPHVDNTHGMYSCSCLLDVLMVLTHYKITQILRAF